MRINPVLIKESLDREAQKKIRKGEKLSGIIISELCSEIIYSRLEDYLPTTVYVQLLTTVNDWMKEKIVSLTA